MNRSIVTTLVAGLIAAATFAVPAQAGHHRHYGHHFVKFHHVHKFHHYRPAYFHYAPVCVHHKWVFTHYGHKKLVCVLWK